MKKILILFMALIVALSCCFIGCDEKESKDNQSSNQNQSQGGSSSKKESGSSEEKQKGGETVVNVTGVEIEPTLSIQVGSEHTLNVTVSPSNATNKNVTFSSSDSSIITVDNDGKICGIKKGNATITVTTEDGNFTASCTITVYSGGAPSLPDVSV